MITELRLSNFQGFSGAVSVPLAPITVIFGPNSSGKSSLIRSLLFISQSAESSGIDSNQAVFVGPRVDLGSFRNTVHRHDEARTISVGLTIQKGISLDVDVLSDGTVGAIRIDGLRGISALRRFGAASEAATQRLERLVFESTPTDGNEYRLVVDDLTSDGHLANDIRDFLKNTKTSEPPVELVDDLLLAVANLRFRLRNALFPTPVTTFETLEDSSIRMNLFSEYFRSVLSHAQLEVSPQFSFMRHLAGLRVIPERFTTLGRADQMASDGGNIQDLLNFTPNLVAQTSSWIFDITKGRYQLELVPFENQDLAFLGEMGALALRDAELGILTTFKDVGTGLSQILPILVTLAKSMNSEQDQKTTSAEFRNLRKRLQQRSAPVLLEQPELHLHPRMQGDLADLFIKASCATSHKQPQIVLETHSENLILRLRKRIREGTIRAEAVSLLYVSRNSADSSSSVRVLELDSNGDFKNDWTEGTEFSDIRLEEMF